MQGGVDVEKMHQEGSRKILVRIAIALVVLGAIAGGYLLFKPKQPNYTMTQAPKEAVIADFPQELLVEKGITVSDSYSLAYNGGNINQPVVTYTSNWTMAKNISEFGTYLKNNGWTITNQAHLLTNNIFYYANNGKDDVNITFATEAGKVKVTISYIKR